MWLIDYTVESLHSQLKYPHIVISLAFNILIYKMARNRINLIYRSDKEVYLSGWTGTWTFWQYIQSKWVTRLFTVDISHLDETVQLISMSEIRACLISYIYIISFGLLDDVIIRGLSTKYQNGKYWECQEILVIGKNIVCCLVNTELFVTHVISSMFLNIYYYIAVLEIPAKHH